MSARHASFRRRRLDDARSLQSRAIGSELSPNSSERRPTAVVRFAASVYIARELSERASTQFRRRRKLACLALVGFCLALLRRHYRRPRRVAHGGAALGAALASAALDGAWR